MEKTVQPASTGGGQPTLPGRLGGLAQRLRTTIDALNSSHAQRLATIVESSDDAIISKDLNGIIATWNRGAEKLFGYKAQEVIGRPITILFPAELKEDEARILASIKHGERIEQYETVRQRKMARAFRSP